MSWVAFTVDEVLGVYPTKRAAIHDNTGSTRLRCRRIRPGAYELRGWDGVGV